jgi:hypothetical protein
VQLVEHLALFSPDSLSRPEICSFLKTVITEGANVRTSTRRMALSCFRRLVERDVSVVKLFQVDALFFSVLEQVKFVSSSFFFRYRR